MGTGTNGEEEIRKHLSLVSTKSESTGGAKSYWWGLEAPAS